MTIGRPRLAVVLFNLGGPDSPAAVGPFLRNLFSDRAILDYPAILRLPLAAFIAAARTTSARANYDRMGGSSPLLKETEAQARALETVLARRMPEFEARAFVAMRYWKPFSKETARAVEAFDPDEVILLPLYPQYSTTTTGSSLKAWTSAYRGGGQIRAVCCYPEAPGLVLAHAAAILNAWRAAGSPSPVRLLFSAHGLPKKIVEDGDPYQSHIERTCRAVAAQLGESWDWQVCYQSRVGPLEWLGPATPDAIEAAGKAGLSVVITPIAFVSEHIETLVELDHDYALVAKAAGVPNYVRAPALGVAAPFIESLGEVVAHAFGRPGLAPFGEACDGGFANCACAAAARRS